MRGQGGDKNMFVKLITEMTKIQYHSSTSYSVR
jgi:hypothetical protein